MTSDKDNEPSANEPRNLKLDYWIRWVVIPILVAAIGAVAVISRNSAGNANTQTMSSVSQPAPTPTGRILSPKSGNHVARRFAVVGTLSAIPRDHYVWVVVQIGNELFPKTPEVGSGGGKWTREFLECGNPPEGRFSLVLLMVNAAAEKRITTWVSQGKQNGFPGFAGIEGSSNLDVVPSLVLSDPVTAPDCATSGTTASS